MTASQTRPPEGPFSRPESNPKGPVLTVVNARKSFGATAALDGASLELGRGELLGLLGPNGAGKTTLIRAIAGRVSLDAGTIELFGRTLARTDPRHEVGVVPQELAIYPLLSATENLEVFGRLYGVSRADLPARVRWALGWADLADRAREPTKLFSGGMKRRLNIACGLMHRPRVLLLDEPTVGIDPQSRDRIYEMLARVREDGVAIVLTSHHLEEVEQRCGRLVIIDRGRNVAAGTVASLVEQTFGRSRTLRVGLAEPLGEAARLPGRATLADTRRVITAQVDPASTDLADTLGAIAAAGGVVNEVALAGATLQDVFIALTGRELRE